MYSTIVHMYTMCYTIIIYYLVFLLLPPMIDGYMLFELDDEMMRDELGMSKKLHRLRLLMIIKGTQSVNSHLKD